MLIGLIGTEMVTIRASNHFEKKFKFRHFQFVEHVRLLCELIFQFSFHENLNECIPECLFTPNQIVFEIDQFLRNIQPIVFQQNLQVYLNENVIVSDIFYKEDAERIKELGGIVIRLREQNSIYHVAPLLCSDYVVEFSTNLESRCEEVWLQHQKKSMSV